MLELSPRTAIAVADGLAYVTGERTITVFESDTGTIRWRATPGLAEQPQIISPPVVAGGHLYLVIVDKQRGAQFGTVIALDARTGVARWLGPSSNGASGVLVAEGDLVIVRFRNRLTALDGATGDRRWRGSTLYSEEVTIADGVIYLRADRDLFAIDAASGRNLWRFTVGRGVYAPVVGNGAVYIDGFRSKKGNEVLFAIAVAPAAGASTGAATPVEVSR
jgi:outer membrane protein assembly factor BamB